MLFRSTAFGDDKDRPLKTSNGDWTYFAADMAYHLNKFHRGFSKIFLSSFKEKIRTIWTALELCSGLK